MSKHPNAFEPGHKRTRWVGFRVSDRHHQQMVARAARAGAVTISAYLRWVEMKWGRKSELPSYASQRELINLMFRVAVAIEQSPPGTAKDRALDSAIAAFDRIAPR